MLSTTPRDTRHEAASFAQKSHMDVVEPRVLSVCFGGQLTELSEVVYVSEKASTSAILKRVYKHLANVEDPVHVWLDTDHLSSGGNPVDAAGVVSSLMYSRSAAGRVTHVKVVVNAGPVDLDSVVESVTSQVSEQFVLEADGLVSLADVEAFEALRLQGVEEVVCDYVATEDQLFAWREACVDGRVLGTVEFRVASTYAGADYLMVGVGLDPQMQTELLVVRNERCNDVLPFSGVGVVVNAWSQAGDEVAQKLYERWEDSAVVKEKTFVKDYVPVSIATWDQKVSLRTEVAHQVAPGIMAALDELGEARETVSVSVTKKLVVERHASDPNSFDVYS